MNLGYALGGNAKGCNTKVALEGGCWLCRIMLGIHGNTCCWLVAVAQLVGGDRLCSADQASGQGHYGDPRLEHCPVGSPFFLPCALPYPTLGWRWPWLQGRWVLFLGARCPWILAKVVSPSTWILLTFWGMCRDRSTGSLNQTIPALWGISLSKSKLYHLQEEVGRFIPCDFRK